MVKFSSEIIKTSSTPNDIGNIYRPRTQEFTGGYNGREMGNYGDLDVNPNESAEGLSHHQRGTPEDAESLKQRDKKERRDKALRELLPGLKHISLSPEDLESGLANRSPRMQDENKLLETGLGVDKGASGIGLSMGGSQGPVRSDTANIRFGVQSAGAVRTSTEVVYSDLLKGKKRYKGRKYEEDEESEEDEEKGRKRRRRKRKSEGGRKGKKLGGKHEGGKGRDVKGRSKRHASQAARRMTLDRQAFAPNIRSQAARQIGASSSIPLRLRDPVAWERKKAKARMQRMMGSMPRAHTHHQSAGSTGLSSAHQNKNILGIVPNTSTRLPASPKMGTSLNVRGQDPLGTSDPLMMRKARGKTLSRSELIHLKAQVERLMRRIEKLTKASPVLDEHSKKGASANEASSEPTGGTTAESAAWIFEDTTAQNMTGKR